MSLTLEAAGPQAKNLGPARRKVFNSAGGTIGRLPGNDWVLPDQFVSGQHAVIHFSDGTYYLEDRSSNGVFINSPETRLPKHQPYALKDGDRFFIDAYEIRVSISSEQPAAALAVAPRSPLTGLLGTPAGGAMIPDEPFAPEDPFAATATSAALPNPVSLARAPVTDPLPVEETDPLRLLGLMPARKPAAPVPRAQDLAQASPLTEPYRAPNVHVPPAAPPYRIPDEDLEPSKPIPDDYDPLAGADIAQPPAGRVGTSGNSPVPRPAGRTFAEQPPERLIPRAQQAAAPPSAPRAPLPPLQSPAAPVLQSPASQIRPSVGSSPSASPARPVPPRRPPVAQPQPLPPTTDRTAPSRVAQVQSVPPETPRPAATTLAGAPPSVDLAALLSAAGLEGAASTPELAALFGRILRVVVTGTMDLLRARERIKDEFRMHMTTFKADDNNPLKFSANVEDALHNLLVKRNSAYLPPVEAFEDAFQDARNHQLAMLAGLRAAFDSMLGEFDPEQLQEQFERQSGKSSLLGMARRRYWDLYRERYRREVQDADTAFRELFGRPFAKAYEEQMERLKAASRAASRNP